ncbi:MAG: aminotransferase class I/II-fold pyridoxal phosphate-dependent enzyme [Bacteroidales bacterium]|nr:aminotransferase class I/II-fold pyridoxal phosphate-dependent enzyme [Bacteroidales bacterium]
MKFNPAKALEKSASIGSHRGVNHMINDSATYTFESGEQMTACFNGELEGAYLYSRHWNPTNFALSKSLAAMEGTEAAWDTGSGMAAITNAILQVCNAGDHIVSSVSSYGGTYAFMKFYLPKFNIHTDFVNITDLDAVEKAIKPNTKILYTESLTNPLLQVADIPALRKIADKYQLTLIIDNTFTPLIISPIQLGADIVVYSLTKFVNGKNDTTAGAICASLDFINSLIDLNDGSSMLLGGVLDSIRAANIHKNLFTLPIRMKKHSENAMFLAQKFKDLGLRTVYPGLPDHPQHELMKELMNPEFGFGGMVSIDLETPERASKFMSLMQDSGVGYLAVSLGYFKTLFSNSGKSTSSEVPEETQRDMGLSPGLVRYSVGLDHDIHESYKVIEECYKKL